MGASNGSGVRAIVDAHPVPAGVALVGGVQVDSPMPADLLVLRPMP
jgi:hypothetical protein